MGSERNYRRYTAARSQTHYCDDCGQMIVIGEEYRRIRGKWMAMSECIGAILNAIRRSTICTKYSVFAPTKGSVFAAIWNRKMLCGSSKNTQWSLID